MTIESDEETAMTAVPNANNWIVYPRPNPQARLRLFCFPYAGGGASIYRLWPNDLPSAVEICSLQPPGRENRLREKPFTHVTPLTQALVPIISPYLNLPFAFFGYSLGSLVAFEVVRELRRQGGPIPLHLFVGGRRAPQIPDPDPPIHQLPEPEFLIELRRLSGTPEAVLQNAELMQLLQPLLRADFAINETYPYTVEPPLACPISAYGGLEDAEADQDDLAPWQEQTRAAFKLQMFPGGHFFLNNDRAPLLQAISEDLYRYL